MIPDGMLQGMQAVCQDAAPCACLFSGSPTPVRAGCLKPDGRPGSPPPPISASAAAVTMPQTGSASCATTANCSPACPCRTAKSNLPASPRKSSVCGNVSAATIFSIPTAKATCLSSSAGHFEVQAAFGGVNTKVRNFCGTINSRLKLQKQPAL